MEGAKTHAMALFRPSLERTAGCRVQAEARGQINSWVAGLIFSLVHKIAPLTSFLYGYIH